MFLDPRKFFYPSKLLRLPVSFRFMFALLSIFLPQNTSSAPPVSSDMPLVASPVLLGTAGTDVMGLENIIVRAGG
jgi:hypothetical protein